MHAQHHIGIDLGGSSVKAAAVTRDGTLLESLNLPFLDRDMEWAIRVEEAVESLRTKLGEPSGIGLSAPGLAAADERSIAFMPGRLHGLEGLDWTRRLGSSTPIPVLNDAHAALLGEAWIGAAAGVANTFMLTLGTGVGGAAIVDGRLLKGRLGRAGHLGHVSVDFLGPLDDVGTPGSIESEIGNKTLQKRCGGRHANTHALVAAVESGDVEARQIWERSVRALGAAVASLINVLDPEVVIIGGGIARAGKTLFGPLATELERVEWRPGGHQVRIVPAQLGDLAGAYGSAVNSIRRPLPAIDGR
jgi:glucokinase